MYKVLAGHKYDWGGQHTTLSYVLSEEFSFMKPDSRYCSRFVGMKKKIVTKKNVNIKILPLKNIFRASE